MVGKEFPAFLSHLKRTLSPQERREELQSRATIPSVPQMSQSIPEEPVFPALSRLSCRGMTHTTVARGTALWESLVGKPRGKASRESHRSLDQRVGKRDTAATAREESKRACPHSRRGLTPLGRLQKYPKIDVSPGEESREANKQLARRVAFPEATRYGPCGPRRKSRALAATRGNPELSTLQAK